MWTFADVCSGQAYLVWFAVLSAFQNLGICACIEPFVGFPGVSDVKNLPAMQEIQVWSLGQEDPLKKGMATLSSILAWKIPWTEEPGGLEALGSQRVGHSRAADTITTTGAFCGGCFVLTRHLQGQEAGLQDIPKAFHQSL